MYLVAETGKEIDAFLAAPVREVSASEFAVRFYAQRLIVALPGSAPHASGQEIAAAIRGTLGHVFAENASPEASEGHPCPLRPACALDVLWRERRHGRGLTIPKPFVIGIDEHPDHWEIIVTVFGLATEWTPTLLDALYTSLRRGIVLPNGSALAAHGASHKIYEIAGLSDGPANFAQLSFLTPLRWRAEGGRSFNVQTFLSMVVNRARGIALWHGLDLQESWHRLPDIAEAIAVDASSLVPFDGRRKSGRLGNIHGVEGYQGAFALFGDLTFCTYLLDVGAIAHVGSGASLGFGRFQLSMA